MPLRILSAYATAMPHVRALAGMRTAEAVAVGGNTLKASARDDILRSWRGDLRRTIRRLGTPEQMKAAATAAGIGFRRVVRR